MSPVGGDGLVSMDLAAQLTEGHERGEPCFGFDPLKDYIVRCHHRYDTVIGPTHSEIQISKGEGLFARLEPPVKLDRDELIEILSDPASKADTNELRNYAQAAWDRGYRLLDLAIDYRPGGGHREEEDSIDVRLAVGSPGSGTGMYRQPWVVYERGSQPPASQEPLWEYLRIADPTYGAPDPRKRPAARVVSFSELEENTAKLGSDRRKSAREELAAALAGSASD